MRYQMLVIGALCAVIAAPAAVSAQPRVEVSGFGGWTVSDGVAGDGILAGDGNIYNAIDIKDSFSWGFGIGVTFGEGGEAGFLFNQQMSTLGVEGTNDVEVGDMAVNSYHPYFAYNFLDSDSKVRPFVLLGLGATNYASVPFSRAGRNGETGSETQFSTTWAAGVKYFANDNVALRVSATWTPTYITTEGGGWWCDPYWGCYVVGDAKYANQFHFNGGLTFRF